MYLLKTENGEKEMQEIVDVMFSTMGIPCEDIIPLLDREEENVSINGVVAILLTKELLLDLNAVFYLEKIKELYLEKKITVMTAMIHMKAPSLPPRGMWLKETDCTYVETFAYMQVFCYRCVKKSLEVLLETKKYHEMNQLNQMKLCNRDDFLKCTIQDYCNIEAGDYQARIFLIRVLFTYIKKEYHYRGKFPNSIKYSKIIQCIFSYSGKCMSYVAEEPEIMEQCFLLAIHELAPYNGG